jgi:hypothetical protein
VVNQVSLRIGETIVGKRAFERFAACHGALIKQYRGDNHPFSAQEFLDELELCEQDITYSGVGAHFQNGVAERALQTVTSWARAMMMHQLLHWPEQFDPALWPFALEHAVFLWNNMPRHQSGLTPLELFTGMKQPQNGAILRSRVWGCPAYVLDPKLQDGKKLPNWTKRSRCGVYLGVSPQHHTTVGRILNAETGSISPQYHVVYDELYSSVKGFLTNTVFDAETWDSILSLDGLETGAESQRPRPRQQVRHCPRTTVRL